jgi:hypothetical protein
MTSCEYSYNYSYKVTNTSGTSINVRVKTFRVDSTFIIVNDSTKVLFTTTHGIEGPHGPYYKDVKFDLDSLIVKNQNDKISTKDYLLNETWTFTEDTYHEGLYSAFVTSDEFN